MSRLADPPEISGATLSPCRRYRFALFRRWAEGEVCCFIGLNPSTADERTDDNTIRKCRKYAKRWGYGGMLMLNVFAWRATQPADLERVSKNGTDVMGLPDNSIEQIIARLQTWKIQRVIGAWGGHAGERGRNVLRGLKDAGFAPECFKTNKDGSPVHPLYQRDDAETIKL